MAAFDANEDGAPLKLLSLDGGGIRGISTLIILKYLMKRVNPENPPKPCDYFDLIGGTSTGGIIAIMLGRLRMDVQECIDKYIELSSAAFTPRRSKANIIWKVKDKWDVAGAYRSDVLAKEIRRAVQDHLESKDPEAVFQDPDSACKVFVCVFTVDRNTPVLLRSYHTQDSIDYLSTSDCTIWQAARATSAAATFFDPIQIGRRTFIDGATGMNNPVEEVLKEAKSLWPNAIAKGRIQSLLSIGTGVPDLKKFGNNMKEVIETLKEIATETEKTEERFYNYHNFLGLGGRYFRFNVNRGLFDVGLDDHKKLAEIEASTEDYLGNPRLRLDIEKFLQAKAPMASLLCAREKEGCLTWLKTIDPLEQHNEARKYRTIDSTGEWFLNHSFKHWKTKSRSFLWLTGKPGSGKTVLSSAIIDKLEKDSTLVVVYFYFSFRQESKQNVANFKYSLLMQLLRRLVREDEVQKECFHVPQVFQKLYQKYKHSQFPLDEHVNATIVGLLSEAEHTYIVVDAVDECPSQVDQTTIITFLGELCRSSHGGLHVLFTSRRELNIENSVTDMKIEKDKVLMETEKVNADIKSYLLDSLGREPWKSWPARLKKEVAKTLTSRSDGVFRWAALQLDSIRDKERDKDVESALQSLPRNLEETYEMMLLRIESADRSNMAVMILQWLAYAKRSLLLSEVAEIAILEMEHSRGRDGEDDYTISYHPRDRFRSIWSARKILSGLITVSGIDDRDDVPLDQDGTVSFSHFTVQEYLQGENANPARFRLEERTAHLCIMRGCLGYLVGYERLVLKQSDSGPDSSPLTSTVEMEEDEPDSGSEFDFLDAENQDTLENASFHPFSLLLYAAKYWTMHAAWLCEGRESKAPGILSRTNAMDETRSILIKLTIRVVLSSKGATEALPSSPADALGHYMPLEPWPSGDEDYSLDFEDPLALHHVCSLGDEMLFQLFLDAGVNINRRHTDKTRPLHRAVCKQHSGIVKQLVERGASVNLQDGKGRTALSLAAGLGLTDVSKYLVDKGANLHIDDMDEEHCGIQAPEVREMYWPFTVFSGQYIHVAARDGKGWEPLHWAIENDHEETALFLIEAGCNIMEPDFWGPCPLSLAIVKSQEAVVKAMISKDKIAVRSGRFGDGWQGLHVAAASRNIIMLQILIPIMEDIKVRDNNGRSAMDLAATGAHSLVLSSMPSTRYPTWGLGGWGRGMGSASATIRLLLEHGSSITPGGPYSSTPLHYASLDNQEEAIETLLDCGADLNARNSQGWSPLMHASIKGGTTALKLLLDHGADVNATNDIRVSALHISCGNGHGAAVKVLLDAGADSTLKDVDGMTPLDIARKRKKNETVIRILSGSLENIIDPHAESGSEEDSEFSMESLNEDPTDETQPGDTAENDPN
ncbi:hypothetical protein F4782DRAFT_55480 [Xylaria castorea]|nr:hypothetical protein F4782DRAFT_55480 [Xylaria castorea]